MRCQHTFVRRKPRLELVQCTREAVLLGLCAQCARRQLKQAEKLAKAKEAK